MNLGQFYRSVRRGAGLLLKPANRAAYQQNRVEFERFLADLGGGAVALSGTNAPTALVPSLNAPSAVAGEIAMLKSIELAGFRPLVLVAPNPWVERRFAAAGARWDSLSIDTRKGLARADAMMGGIRTFEDLLDAAWEGIRVGRFTAATTMRELRRGRVDLRDASIRDRVREGLARSIAAAEKARAIVAATRPKLGVFVDRGYSPQGEIFDAALAANVDTITWNMGHRSNTVVLKRYHSGNRDEHFAGLSSTTWDALKARRWTSADRSTVAKELDDAYSSGDWMSEVGTQFRSRIHEPAQIRSRLGIAPGRKVVGVFPHIFWDGSFFWGRDLFHTYREWFTATMGEAIRNDRVDWVVKVHPANLVKSAREGVIEEAEELTALREVVPDVPSHIHLLPPETDISTHALLSGLDYCLTVRGTVGIEAAAAGVRVITGGTGRFDRRGFTVDPSSTDEYLHLLRQLPAVAPMQPEERVLAEKFAYGVFILKTTPLTSVEMTFARDAKATPLVRFHPRSANEWRAAPDMSAIAAWLADGRQEDLLLEPGQAAVGGTR